MGSEVSPEQVARELDAGPRACDLCGQRPGSLLAQHTSGAGGFLSAICACCAIDHEDVVGLRGHRVDGAWAVTIEGSQRACVTEYLHARRAAGVAVPTDEVGWSLWVRAKPLRWSGPEHWPDLQRWRQLLASESD